MTSKSFKRVFSVLLSVFMLAGILPVFELTAHADPWGGSWTTSTGYSVSGTTVTISTANGLAYFMTQIANGTTFSGYTVNLTTDVNLNNTNFTKGSSYRDKSFKGTFNGNNHTISGLYITGSWDRVALFMRTDSATIKNLTMKEQEN